MEYGANGTPTGTYEYGVERLSVEYVNSAKEYYLYSGTGSVVQTSEQNGSLFLRQTYDPFGNSTKIRSPLTVDIDDLNRYTYNGEDYDYNTGLQYLRARYYNTSTGSFISQDTYLGQIINPISRNRYTYAHNSPVVFDDPSGNEIVVVSGGKYGGDENAKKYQYEFIDTALLELSTIENTDEKITWLVAEADWSGDDIDYFQTMAEKYCKNNVEVIGFSSSDELVNYINYGNIKGNEDKDTRVFDPITSFSSYSHGKLYQIAYGYNLQNHFEHALSIRNEFSLSIKQIKQIKSSAFSPNSKSIFYSCRTGNKIAQYWADYTQSTTFAVGGKNNSQGRTDYAYTRGNNLSDETIEEIAKQYEYYNNKRKEALNDYYVYSEFRVGKVKDIIYNLALTAYEYKFYKSLYEKVNAAEQYQNKRDCSADDVYPAFTSPIPSLEEDSYWKLFLPKS